MMLGPRVPGTLLLLLTALALYCGMGIAINGAKINTDLKSLSPALNQVEAVNQALDDIAADTATTVTLLLTSSNQNQLEDAGLLLEEILEQPNNSIEYVDQAELLDSYVATLTEHRYHLLTEGAQQALHQSSDQQILTTVQRRLYGQDGLVRLIPLHRDPFGYTNEFVLTAAERMGANAAARSPSASQENEQMFNSVHTLRLPASSLEMQTQQESVKRIEQLAEQLKAEYPSLNIARSGMIFYAADAAQNARADITLISTGSSLAILVLVLVVFRQLGALVLPIASIACGSAFAFVLCHAFFGSVHILTIVFGASLIGVVIDYCLHYFYLYQEDNSASRLHLHKALFMSLMTSVIGYGALSLSGLKALQQIALFSALGLIYAWLVVVVIGRFFARRIALHDRYLRKMVDGLMGRLQSLPRPLLPLCVLGALAVLAAATGLSFPSNDSPKAFVSANPYIVAQEQQVSAASVRYEPASFILVEGESTQGVYNRIQALKASLTELDSPTLSIETLLPSPAEQERSYELNGRLYGDKGLVKRLLQDGPLSSLDSNTYQQSYRKHNGHLLMPAALLDRLQGQVPPLWIVDHDHIYSFVLIPQGTNIPQLRQTVKALPQVKVVSAIEETTAALRDLRIAALQLLVAGVGIIALLMMARFGWKTGVRLMLVPCCTLLFTLLLLSLLSVELTLFHVMALFLVLGLGMDYVIFAAEIKHQHQRTLCAIVLSATTSLLSFGLLSLSSLPAVNAFGVTVLLGNSLNLVGSILLTSRLYDR